MKGRGESLIAPMMLLWNPAPWSLSLDLNGPEFLELKIAGGFSQFSSSGHLYTLTKSYSKINKEQNSRQFMNICFKHSISDSCAFIIQMVFYRMQTQNSDSSREEIRRQSVHKNTKIRYHWLAFFLIFNITVCYCYYCTIS